MQTAQKLFTKLFEGKEYKNLQPREIEFTSAGDKLVMQANQESCKADGWFVALQSEEVSPHNYNIIMAFF